MSDAGNGEWMNSVGAKPSSMVDPLEEITALLLLPTPIDRLPISVAGFLMAGPE